MVDRLVVFFPGFDLSPHPADGAWTKRKLDAFAGTSPPSAFARERSQAGDGEMAH